MMKRLLAVLVTLMLFSSPAWAQEAGSKVEKAASLPDWTSLERYASFDREGTVWTVRSNQGEAALAQMGWGYAPYDGYVCFGLELTGDSETGVTVPVLAFYYDGTAAFNGRAASVAVNGVRYDFVLSREEVQVGKVSAERLTAPLNAEGLEMIRAMLEAERVQIWLQGDRTFEMNIDPADDSFASIREELAVRSMKALGDMLREFEAIAPYELWDLNEAWWQRTMGAAPQMRRVNLGEGGAVVSGVALKAPMNMLSRGAMNENVRALQKLLISGGFMQGSADGAYGEGTVRAVEAAQKWFSLPATGSADETLIRLLSGESASDAEADAHSEAAPVHTAQGVCELSIGRYWFADAVESTGGDRRNVLDKDDTMIIYEGEVKNLSMENLDFYWQMSATVYCGDYGYPCVLVCERDEGDSLTSALPPLGQARLLIYAEIPENIASQEQWSLKVSAGECEILFD